MVVVVGGGYNWGVELVLYHGMELEKSFDEASGRVTAGRRTQATFSPRTFYPQHKTADRFLRFEPHIAPKQCCYGRSSAPFSGLWPPLPRNSSPPGYPPVSSSPSSPAAWQPPLLSALPPSPPPPPRPPPPQSSKPAHRKYSLTQPRHYPTNLSRSWLRSRPSRRNTSQSISTSSRSWSLLGISSGCRSD